MASNYDDRSSSYADNLSFFPKNVQNARLQSSLIWKVIICWIEIRSRQKRKLCMKCALLYSNLLLLEYNPKLRLSRTGKFTLIPPTGGEPRGRDVSGSNVPATAWEHFREAAPPLLSHGLPAHPRPLRPEQRPPSVQVQDLPLLPPWSGGGKQLNGKPLLCQQSVLPVPNGILRP